MIDYSSKYEGVQLSRVDPSLLTDSDECLWLMSQLDQQSASIQGQLELAMADAHTGNFADPHWFAAAKAALRYAKRTRNAIQMRVGVIRRENHANRGVTYERAFIDAAVQLLKPETVKKIWDRVHENHPELPSKR